MTEDATHVEQVAREIRLAYEAGDVERFAALLSPRVSWGPPGGPAVCRSKRQVLAWYENGSRAGAHARVQEITIVGARLLVGLVVTNAPGAIARPGRATRWQVLTVRKAQIIDIVGFDHKSDATAWMSQGDTGR